MTSFNNWCLCCISKTLSDHKVNFKTMTLTQFNKLPKSQAMAELCQRILHNFKITHRTIQFCINHKISGYRLSSSLCPIISHPSIDMNICDLPNFADIQTVINSIKDTLAQHPIKISAHPSEYISLSTTDERILQNTHKDLQQHAELFDLLGLPQDYSAPLNIHVRKDGDPSEVSSNVMRNYSNLPDNVRNRLVFENNDNKSGVWSIQNLVKYFFKPYNIPITFDFLHHSLLPGDLNEQDAFNLAYSTWGNHVPVFHYSEGIVENNVVTRKHKDMPDSFPTIYNPNVYLDVELKSKCQAILKLQNS